MSRRRAKPLAATDGAHAFQRVCEAPGCRLEGEYRAPFARDRLDQHRWFCLEHVRDYNKKWDYFAGLDGTGFASGHTHMQGVWVFDPKVYCNPGSVGQPRDGDPRAAFAVWAYGQPTLCRVSYDIDATCRLMQRAGFESHVYENLRRGSRIGVKH